MESRSSILATSAKQDPRHQINSEGLFKRIYRLAKARNTAELQSLKESLGDLECHDFQYPLFTPAGLLAAEKDVDSVNYLRDQFQVDVNNIVRGYAIAGLHEEVERHIEEFRAKPGEAATGYAYANNKDKVQECRDKYPKDKKLEDYIVFGAAAANNVPEVQKSRAKGASEGMAAQGFGIAGNEDELVKYAGNKRALSHAMYGLIAGGHKDKIIKLYKKFPRHFTLKDMLLDAGAFDYFSNSARTLHSLTFFQKDARAEIADALDESKRIPFPVKPLVKRAEQVDKLLNKHTSFNYAKSAAWSFSEIQTLFFQEKRIPAPLLIHIASFISPLSAQDGAELTSAKKALLKAKKR